MEATKNQSSDGQSIPVLCPMGCGFFGNPTFENYCSQCYRQREQADKANMMREKLETTSPGVVVSSPSGAVAASASSPSPVGAAPQKLLAPATPQAIEQAVTQLLSPTLLSAKPTAGATLLTAAAAAAAGSGSAGGAAAIPEQASDPGVAAILPAAAKPTPPPDAPPAPALPWAPAADSGRPATTFTTALPAPEPPARPVQKTKSKCFLCRAKIPLAMQITNQCRCEYVFCNSHRHPDQHDCDFEYKTEGRAILAKNNPKLDDHKGGRSFTRLD